MEDLLASVSGGESSRKMLDEILKDPNRWAGVFPVFGNTGLEHEETIIFLKRIQDYTKKEIVCLEADVKEEGVGTKYKRVSLDNLSMNGEPMEEVIAKYGLPGLGYLHCTRELKKAPIHAWAKEKLSPKYETAIGIRYDEIDRMDAEAKEKRYIYPLIKEKVTKFDVIQHSLKQPFKLGIPQWLGNCTTCYKKSDRKLAAVYRYNPKLFEFWSRMEKEYGHIKENTQPRRIFRENRTTAEMVDMFTRQLSFDDTASGCGGNESCEAF